MIVENTGLQTTALTWYLAFGLLAVWVLSLPLLVRVRSGWEQVIMSLPGLAWIGFGIGIVFRFFVLTYDAEAFASPSTTLADRLPAVVNLALTNAGLYWVCFVAAALATRLIPVPRLLASVVRRPENLGRLAIVPAVVVCCVCVALSLMPSTPVSLVTPLSVFGSMWVIPATSVWVRRFRGEPIAPVMLLATLAPGVLRAVLSPYREHLTVIALVVLVATISTGRRFRLAILVPATLAFVLVSTIVITTYRQVIWSGLAPEQAISRVSLDQWATQPFEAPWTEVMRRFHDFDSLLLTVDLVPDVLPFSGRQMLTEGLTRGLLPRLLDSTKRSSDEGVQFQTLIWSYDDDPTREVGTASIAPSMPGSLYVAGGMLEVAGGALLWGLLVAFVERLKSEVFPPVAAGVHVLWAVQALAGIERDFSQAFANGIQTVVMFLLVCFLIGRREPALDASPVEAVASVGP